MGRTSVREGGREEREGGEGGIHKQVALGPWEYERQGKNKMEGYRRQTELNV